MIQADDGKAQIKKEKSETEKSHEKEASLKYGAFQNDRVIRKRVEESSIAALKAKRKIKA